MSAAAFAAPFAHLAPPSGEGQSMIVYDVNRWKRLFPLIWGGQALSLLGTMSVQFALIWWLTRTTGSA